MQDDPEGGECFQHKMILKRRQRGEGTLRVNANHHAACTTSHADQDARIRGGRLSFTGTDRKQIYGLVERTLQAHEYLRLAKKDKGVVRRYLAKISGRSLAQITRLIRRYRQSGAVEPAPPASLPAPLHTRRTTKAQKKLNFAQPTCYQRRIEGQ